MVWILSARLHRRLVAKCKFAIGTCVLYLNESRLEFAPQKTEQVFFILYFSGEQKEDAAYRAQVALFFFFGGGGGREGDCRFNQDKLRLCRPLGSSADWPLKNVITTLTYLQGVNFGPRVEGQGLLRMYSSWTTVVFRVSNKVCNFLLFNLLERVSVRSRSRE